MPRQGAGTLPERSDMGKMSREKGKRGERALSNKFKDYGYKTRRGQQFCGSNGDADVVGVPGVHIECKWVESLNLRKAMEQSKNDAKENEMPMVFHKKNGKEWLVTMSFDDFIKMYREYAAGMELGEDG